MTRSKHHGTIVLSVDLSRPSNRSKLSTSGQLSATVNDLAQSMRRSDVRATWAASPDAALELVSLIHKYDLGHEIGLSADSAWIRGSTRQRSFTREIGRRVAQFREHGLDVSSLLFYDAAVPNELHALAKHGISAIRGSSRRLKSCPSKNGPKTIRFGIWYEPVDARLPGLPVWLGRRFGRPYRVASRAARVQAAAHVAIDATELAERGRSAMRAARRLIGYVADLRDNGQVIIATLADAARRGRGIKAASPTRSILRPAA